MKVFLTGATGFVGGHLLKALRAKGHEVRCLIRSGREAWKIGGEGIGIAPGDILQPETLPEGMKGIDAVIHLVGIIQEAGGATFQRIHFEGARNVIDAARKAGIKRFIHMSALGAREGARSRYHQTKFQAEEYLKRSGLDYTIFRPSVIFGPGDGFVNLLADLVRKAPIVPIIGSGKNKLQPISVYDVAEFFARALEEPRTIRQVYGLGGAEPIEYREIVKKIAAALGRRRLTVTIPFAVMAVPITLMNKLLPRPPITWDQFLMLQEDNTCDMTTVLSVLPLALRPFDPGIREYLVH